MDGAYDSEKSYRLLGKMRIKPIIKSRKNAGMDRGPPERRRSVVILKTLGILGYILIINLNILAPQRQLSHNAFFIPIFPNDFRIFLYSD